MRLCFIWHMHQPYYKDPLSGVYLLPWVRLHGCKDYLDMACLADDYPSVKMCFNLVPSLIDQLNDYAAGSAVDEQLELARRRPDELSDLEKIEVTRQFFSANPPTMIEPYPRYHELWQLCQELRGHDLAARLSDQDLLDLQVWYNACWIDPTLRQDQRVRGIYEKGRDFTEAEKQALLDYQLELCGKAVPAYRERQDIGKIEVSFSPYYHPILPLLIDTEIAKVAMPNAKLPERRFEHPEDARWQIEQAVALYRELFGREQQGMWPSEGSVSEDLLPLLAEQGIKWIATDEEVYRGSLPESGSKGQGGAEEQNLGFHQAWRVGRPRQEIGILFRDHTLSDKIGFVYSKWEAEKAADDFIAQLLELNKLLSSRSKREPLVSIILDGENAWEYYRNDGVDFLKALYERLEQNEQLKTVLPGEVFTEDYEIGHLPKLFPGSWISHDFHVWIGHEEDNRAWDLLAQTRGRLVDFLAENPQFPEEKKATAWKEVYIAEGSDWCWWYGDDHYTEHFDVFDRLFRRHLRSVWDLIGEPPPAGLLRPLRHSAAHKQEYSEPTDWIKPVIDGRQTHFFEWYGAGKLECYRQGSAMHRSDHLLHQLMFGYDQKHLFFRLDFESEALTTGKLDEVRIELVGESRALLTVREGKAHFKLSNRETTHDHSERVELAGAEIMEISIPRELLVAGDEGRLLLACSLLRAEKEVEKWPGSGYIELRLPQPGETLFWEL